MLELKAGGMRPTDIAKALKTGEPHRLNPEGIRDSCRATAARGGRPAQRNR
jgi:hypothetical protein